MTAAADLYRGRHARCEDASGLRRRLGLRPGETPNARQERLIRESIGQPRI